MKKTLFIMIAVALLVTASSVEAKGGSFGGGRSFSAPRVSAPRVSTPKVSTPSKPSAPKVTTPSKPATPKITTKPSVQTKVNTAATTKTVAGKSYGKKSYTVGDTYQPRFNGYVPAQGSQVYYRSSAWDWFPMYYILMNSSHKEAVVVEPNGTEKVVKEEGTDSMYIINWILTILILGGLIAGIVYIINKLTTKKNV